MASSSRGHDYTEGASAIDIQYALDSGRRSRSDSQYDDGEGNMFDGPGHSVNPSSVSRMSLSEHGRKSSEGRRGRRGSEDVGRPTSRSGRQLSRDSRRSSQISLATSEPVEHADLESDDNEDGRGRYGRHRRKSLSPPPKSTMFGNIVQMFGRAGPVSESPARSRRPSLSSRSSRSRLLRRHSSGRSDAGSDYAVESPDEEERWGYASGEDDSDLASLPDVDHDSIDYRSIDEASYPDSPGLALHVMAGDPIFGEEARIDMGELDLLEPPPPGPPSRQTLFIEDEDAHVRFVGYDIILARQWFWRLCCILSFGILGLLGHWFPRLWLRWVTKEKAFKDLKHGFIVIEVSVNMLIC
jgi:cation-transporting P-type ATPase 13A2